MIFNQKIVDEILFYTKQKLLTESSDVFHNQKDIEAAIEALAELMLIEDDLIMFNQNTFRDFEDRFFTSQCLEVINPEAFFKKLLRVVDMQKWNSQPQDKWMMGKLFGAFRLYDRYDAIKHLHLDENNEFVLSKCNPQDFEGTGELRLEYCGIRWLRNEPEHGYWSYIGQRIRPDTLYVVRGIILCILVDMCGKYKKQIHKKYVAQIADKCFDVKAYAQLLIDGYQDREEKYLRTHWTPLNIVGDNMSEDIIQLMAKLQSNRVIKLIGCAGVGKTESMMYATYYKAKKLIVKNGKGKLPIYIPLIQIKEKGITIKSLIKETLGLKLEETECVLEAKECIFLLDGYNEILDVELRKTTATEIRDMFDKYKNAQFVIGDRSTKTMPPCATQAICYGLEPLNREQIEKFFERNCCIEESTEKDEKTLNIIKASYDEKFVWLEKSSVTPYMLKVLIEMIQNGKAIPDNEMEFFRNELEFKLEREFEKKLDYRIPALKECLKELTKEVLIGRSVDISIIQSSFRKSGIGLEDALKYVELVSGLDILERDDEDLFRWRRAEYFSYFFMEYQKRYRQ